jgi:parallel beta-helix repeat protein
MRVSQCQYLTVFQSRLRVENLPTLILAAALALLVALGPLQGSTPAASHPNCARFATPAGSDASPGTRARPYRTVQKLVDELPSGQTGCLRRGKYRESEVTIGRPGIRLTGDRGRRAILIGRLRVNAARVKVDRLKLVGRNPSNLPSPTINADNVVFRDNNVFSPGGSSCFLLGGTTHVRNSVIVGNRIHDCGETSTNFDHGIYMSDVDGARIIGNTIYDNGSRGIKIGPDSQGALIRGNVIDGNPIGLTFSGDEESTSSHNVVVHNVISNSTRWWNVQTYWPGEQGTGNVVRQNCFHGGNSNPHYNERGGVSEEPGFTSAHNLIAAPSYIDRGAKNFRLRGDSPCWRVYRP